MTDTIDRLEQEIDSLELGPENHRFKQLRQFVRRWDKFFRSEIYCKKTDHILDFGCASGFSIFTGQMYGFENVYGLDVDVSDNAEFYYPLMREVSKIIGVDDKIKVYCGHGELPFEDNTFDAIVSFSAITKDFSVGHRGSGTPERLRIRVRELDRISRPAATWFVYPVKHLDLFRDLSLNVGLSSNIKFKKLNV